jgi:hypothetical protein
VKPARIVLNVAACVLVPFATTATVVYLGLDWFAAHVRRSHPALTAALAEEWRSWVEATTEGAP